MKNQEFYFFSRRSHLLCWYVVLFHWPCYFSINLRTCYRLTNSELLYQVFQNFYSPTPLHIVSILIFKFKKYVEILKNYKSDIDNLHPNGILLLWDNDSKHKSEVSLDYYTENKIQLFEWPAYSPDLNPIENVWANIKYKLAGNT